MKRILFASLTIVCMVLGIVPSVSAYQQGTTMALYEDFSRFDSIIDSTTSPLNGDIVAANAPTVAGTWSAVTASGLTAGSSETIVTTVPNTVGGKAVKVESTSAGQQLGVQFLTVAPFKGSSTENTIIECRMKNNSNTTTGGNADVVFFTVGGNNSSNSSTEVAGIELQLGSTSGRALRVKNALAAWSDARFEGNSPTRPTANTWYVFKFYLDFETDTFKIFVSDNDGVTFKKVQLTASGNSDTFAFVPVTTATKGIRQIKFYSDKASAEAYLDYVRIYSEDKADPEPSVTTPAQSISYYALSSPKFLNGAHEYANTKFIGADTSVISIESDAALLQSSLTASSITLTNMTDSTSVALSSTDFSLSQDNRTLYINTASKLGYFKDYKLTVTTDVAAIGAEQLASDYDVIFKTQKQTYSDTTYYEESFDTASINLNAINGVDSRGVWTIRNETGVMTGATGISSDFNTNSVKTSLTEGSAASTTNHRLSLVLNTPIDVYENKIITVNTRVRRTQNNGFVGLPYLYNSNQVTPNPGAATIIQNFGAANTSRYFNTNKTNQSLLTFDSGKWYDVKAMLNFETQTNDVYVNGIRIIKDGLFRNNDLEALNQLAYTIEREEELYIDYIKVSGGVETPDLMFSELHEGEETSYYTALTNINKNLRVTAKPQIADNDKVCLFVAAYDSTGKLYKIAVNEVLNANYTGEIYADIDLTSIIENQYDYKLVAYIWNGDFKPIEINSSRTIN